jgi:tRNA pseudouridine55 synthase
MEWMESRWDLAMDGFLNFNKPVGLTSHDCVAKVRRLLGQKRIGHAGTLDPGATGVLPIALGRATRLLPFLLPTKAYHATIRLGVQTTTDDLEGEVLQVKSAAHLTLAMVQEALQPFQGVIQQLPPRYSAVQVRGKRLYELARTGQAVEVQPRPVEVFQLTILDWHPAERADLEVEIVCGSGTYIRSIARDLGAALQTGGTLAALLRTESSGFHLEDSLCLDDLEAQIRSGTFHPIAPEMALAHLPAIALTATLAKRWCQGQRLFLERLDELPVIPLMDWSKPYLTVRIHNVAGEFLGITQLSRQEDGFLFQPQVVYLPWEVGLA